MSDSQSGICQRAHAKVAMLVRIAFVVFVSVARPSSAHGDVNSGLRVLAAVLISMVCYIVTGPRTSRWCPSPSWRGPVQGPERHERTTISGKKEEGRNSVMGSQYFYSAWLWSVGVPGAVRLKCDTQLQQRFLLVFYRKFSFQNKNTVVSGVSG